MLITDIKHNEELRTDFEAIDYYDGDVTEVRITQGADYKIRSLIGDTENISLQILKRCADIEQHIRNILRDIINIENDLRVYPHNTETIRVEMSTPVNRMNKSIWFIYLDLNLDSILPLLQRLYSQAYISSEGMDKAKVNMEKYTDFKFVNLLEGTKRLMIIKDRKFEELLNAIK